MSESNTEDLSRMGDKPAVRELIELYQRSGGRANAVSRGRTAEESRMCVWAQQDPDGRKHDRPEKRAFPWDGANDARVFVTDEVAEEHVDVLEASFWRALLWAQGSDPGKLDSVGLATTYLDWLVHGKLMPRLIEAVPLTANYQETAGWTALHVYWDRKIARRHQRVTLEELAAAAAAAQGDPQNPLAFLPTLILDPALEAEAVRVFQSGAAAYAQAVLPEDLRDEVPVLSARAARRCVRELREEGKTRLPMPYLCRNQVAFRPLKPGRDIVLPDEAATVDEARAVFVRAFYTEPELRAQQLTSGWNERWTEEALKTKGCASAWSPDDGGGALLDGTLWSPLESREELIEVVTAYHRQVDEDGVEEVFYTVFSPHVNKSPGADEYPAAVHGPLGYPGNRYPIMLGRREVIDHHVQSSRGLPEIMNTDQREEKVHHDAVTDLTSIAVLPPLNVFDTVGGAKYRFGPDVQNVVRQGKVPELMNIPTHGGQLSMQMLQFLKTKRDFRWGRMSAEVPPTLVSLKQEPRVRRFLAFWSEGLDYAYRLTLQFAPEQIQQVTGTLPDNSAEEIEHGTAFRLHFDVSQMDPDLMAKKLEAFTNLIQEDAEGVIDRSALVKLKAMVIDPTLARQMVLPKEQASQKLFDKVNGDLVSAFAGNEPVYADAANDPAAGGKLQYAQDIISKNPFYVAGLPAELVATLFGGQPPPHAGTQVNPVFSAYVANYLKNLQQGKNQQDNKLIGRTGVKQLSQEPGGMGMTGLEQ